LRRVRGRPRHGSTRKESKTISLDVGAIERLEKLGNDCLSTGVAIAEHIVRGLPPEVIARARLRLVEPRRHRLPEAPGSWIVFELVDGPPDPPEIPEGGEQLDAWSA